MTREKTEIYCAECGTWLTIDHGGSVTCECGTQFSMTETPVPERRPEADRTPSPRGHPVRLDLSEQVQSR